MSVKISTVIIGSIDIDVDALKAIEGVTIFKVTDRKSCEEIIDHVASNDVVFIISDGREVYYAEKFFARIKPLKIFLVTEAQAADNKNLRDVLIQIPAQNFKQSAYEIANVFNDMLNVEGLVGLDFENVKTALKNSGKAVSAIGEAAGENAIENAIQNALDNPEIKFAQSVLVNLKTSTASASMTKINAAMEKISKELRDEAEIIWGVTIDDSLGDKVKVAIIAGKFRGLI